MNAVRRDLAFVFHFDTWQECVREFVRWVDRCESGWGIDGGVKIRETETAGHGWEVSAVLIQHVDFTAMVISDG